MADAGTPAALRGHAAGILGGKAFLRFSRDEAALFVTDLKQRVGADEAGACLAKLRESGWNAEEKRGLYLLTPSAPLVESLCRPARFPPAGDWTRAEAFADLLRRYATGPPSDPAFVLCLLRGIVKAGQGDPDAFRQVRQAYARGLADGKNLRTALTAALAYELAGALAERGMP